MNANQEITQFSNNSIQVKKRIRQLALSNKVLPMHLQSELFYFALDHFHTQKHTDISYKKFSNKVMEKCQLNLTLLKTPPPIVSSGLLTMIVADDYEKFDEDLEAQIDLKKVIVVDNKETLDLARQYLKSGTEVGVDLEGQLDKDGIIELIQISCNDKIFIFDVYGVQKKAENLNSIESSEYKSLAKELALVIKEVMENEKILKVFHDCRKDSLALHCLINSCVVNVIDVSAVHSFIQNLQRYLNFSDILHIKDFSKLLDNKKKSKEKKKNLMIFK